jgi:flagellar export protein FliJ
MEDLSGLESLLRLRQGFERAARVALQRVFAEINETQFRLEKVIEERRRVRTQLAGQLRKGLAAGDFVMYSVKPLEGQEAAMRKMLTQLEEVRVKAEQKYAECRRERKLMENMIARKREEYRQEAERREQRLTDEATLRRMKRVRLA